MAVSQELITVLFDRWVDRPILVIGGGPSVKHDLPRLREMGVEPACVISANEHGCKQDLFRVDLIIHRDHTHCLQKVKMEPYLRPFGVPLVNVFSWADYRLPDWRFAGNSGMSAIALACALGGHPVIVTGIDMWHGGRLYFHDEKGARKPPKRRRVGGEVRRRDRDRVLPLRAFAKGAHVRPMSGPLLEWFAPFDPAETLKPQRPVGYRLRLEEEAPRTVRAEVVRAFRFANHDYAKLGHVLALSPNEANETAVLCNTRRVDIPK